MTTPPMTDERLAEDEAYVKSYGNLRAHRVTALIAEVRRLREPTLARNQPCGCVTCICADLEKCHGCGAKNCGTHEAGVIPNPVYKDHPLSARITSLECALVTMREALQEAMEASREQWVRSINIEQCNAALSTSADYENKVVVDKDDWEVFQAMLAARDPKSVFDATQRLIVLRKDRIARLDSLRSQTGGGK